MPFDLDTVRFITVCLSLLQAVFLIVFAALVRRYRGVNYAALGNGLFTMAIGMSGLVTILPPFVYFVVTPALLMLGGGILSYGIGITANRPPRLIMVGLPALVDLIVLGALYFFVPSGEGVALRGIVSVAVTAFLFWWIGYTIWNSPYRPMYSSYRLTAVLFWVLGAVIFVRIFVLLQDYPNQGSVNGEFGQVITFLVLVGCSALWTMGYVLMISQQLMGELEKTATTDFLTGTLNRQAAQARLDAEAARARRTGAGFSILLMDFDYFKDINDHYGHKAGDQVLIGFVEILEKQVRANEFLARWGGEEFLMMLETANVGEAGQAAERLRELVAAHVIEADGHKFQCSVCIGVGTFVPTMKDVDECVARADAALYRAKDSGRNRVEMYRDELMTIGGRE